MAPKKTKYDMLVELLTDWEDGGRLDLLIDTLGTLIGTIDAATTDSLHGKLGTDTELADYSLYDLLGGNAFKTNALSAMLGAFTAAQNLKAILGNLTTTKNLGGILGALTTTDNLKAILGAYTAAANLKAAIDAIPTTMVGTDNAALASVLGALDTAAAEGAVTDADEAMAYIKQLVTAAIALATAVGNIPTTMVGTDNAALASVLGALNTAAAAGAVTDVDEAMAYIKQLVTELIVVDGIVDDIKTQTDKIAGKMLFTMDFWSLPQEEVAITDTAGDKALPSVTVADLPGTATIVRAIAMFKFRMVENHTYAGANALNGAQEIQVAGSVDAINFVDTQFTLAQDTREGGDVIIGVIDIATTVNANGAYAFHWDMADAQQDGIKFNDVQCGLRIWYSV